MVELGAGNLSGLFGRGRLCLSGFKAFRSLFISFVADRTLEIISKPLSTLTHPSDLLGRVSQYQRVVGYVPGDHRPCPDKAAAQRRPADDRRIGSDGRALLDQCGPHLVHLPNLRPGVVDIGEDHRGATEDAVLQPDTFLETVHGARRMAHGKDEKKAASGS